MTDPETPDEAYERLLRETRLGEQIDELEQFLGFEAERPGLGCLLSVAQLRVLIGQLRELRARRIAMGREPDDEVNAPADMCAAAQAVTLTGDFDEGPCSGCGAVDRYQCICDFWDDTPQAGEPDDSCARCDGEERRARRMAARP